MVIDLLYEGLPRAYVRARRQKELLTVIDHHLSPGWRVEEGAVFGMFLGTAQLFEDTGDCSCFSGSDAGVVDDSEPIPGDVAGGPFVAWQALGELHFE